MNFRHPIPRSGKPIKKKARSKAERLRIYGPPGYVEWCKAQPCLVCRAVGYSEVAHIRTGGTGRKDDWTRTVPLCGRSWPDRPEWAGLKQGCHAQLHRIGRGSFELANAIDLEVEAQKIQALWEDTETT